MTRDIALGRTDSILTVTSDIRALALARRKPRILKPVLYLLSQLEYGRLFLTLPDGQTLHFRGKKNGPDAAFHLHHYRALRRFMTGGKLGFCESYLDGDWSSPDIATFFELILRNQEIMKKTLHGRKWIRALSWAAHKIRPNSRRGARKNIYRHYDIGNDFYEAWLDGTMTYSAASFQNCNTDLAAAQLQKYEDIIARADIRPHHHVLEIGCGWGGFATYVARTKGCRVTAVTISQAQYEYAQKRIKEEGLDDRVTILLHDYRDIEGSFDRAVSIEMFEAVGEKYWPVFFGKLAGCLRPQGKALLQVITIADSDFAAYRKSADYIQRYIFPGGMLPSKKVLRQKAQQAGLSVSPYFCFGADYGKTLDIWHSRFQKAWPLLARKGYDARFKRLWEQYLSYCSAGFRAGTVDVVHAVLEKPS